MCGVPGVLRHHRGRDDRAQALLGVCVAAVVAVVMYRVFGRVSDAVGRKPVLLVGMIAMGVSVLPVFALINTGRPGLFLLALVLVFGLAMAPAAGVTGSLFSLAFDADVRYSVVSLGYTLSAVVGSAFAPTIATALYAATQSSDSIAAYMIAVSVISAVSVSLMPGPWRQPRVR